jgi:DNA-binding IscR family transcriptional regulator
VALHILAHLAEAGERPTTSETLAAHCRTNPVVIRRPLAQEWPARLQQLPS